MIQLKKGLNIQSLLEEIEVGIIMLLGYSIGIWTAKIMYGMFCYDLNLWIAHPNINPKKVK